jgi:hypothetical protein
VPPASPPAKLRYVERFSPVRRRCESPLRGRTLRPAYVYVGVKPAPFVLMVPVVIVQTSPTERRLPLL